MSLGVSLLVVVVQLSNLGGNLPNLPPLQAVLGVKHLSVLLLKFPQLRVDIEGATKIGLPLLMAVLRQVSAKEPS